MIAIRPVTAADSVEWLRMRQALWPDDEVDEASHQAAIERYFAGHRHEPLQVLLAIDAAGKPIGFAELSIRNIVDGCSSGNVGYLEGWYVDPHARRQKIGAALVAAAEQWAISQGCTEFASDVLVDNDISLTAHLALGFEKTSRVQNFRKTLVRSAKKGSP